MCDCSCILHVALGYVHMFFLSLMLMVISMNVYTFSFFKMIPQIKVL